MIARASLLALLAVGACGFGDNSGYGAGASPDAGVDAAGGGGGGGGSVDAATVTPPDAPSEEEDQACTVAPQSGCSGLTPACDITEADDAEGTTACREVTVPGTTESRCYAETGCAAGYSCVNDVGSISSCMKYCTIDNDCSGAGSRCVFPLEDDLKVCSNGCDLYFQTGCPMSMGCVSFESAAGDYTDCRVMGDQYDGESCTSGLDCRPGSLCVNVGGTASCYSYCKMGVAGQCPSFETCRGFSNPLTIGTTTYGFCE